MANVFHPFSLTAKRDQPMLGLFPTPPLSPLPFYSLSLLSRIVACSASQPAVLKNICFIINHGNTVAVRCTSLPLLPIKFKSMLQPWAPCRYFPKCKKMLSLVWPNNAPWGGTTAVDRHNSGFASWHSTAHIRPHFQLSVIFRLGFIV